MLNQWNQLSLKLHYSSLLVDDVETNNNITVLNAKIHALSELIEISKAHRIAYITIRNFIFSFLITVFGIYIICVVFHRSTFLDLYALLPTSLLCTCRNGWRRLLSSLGLTINNTEYKSVSSRTTHIQRTFFICALIIIGIWWSLMMITLLIIFANVYRPTVEWRWQLTLFNSAHDAYILIIGICVFGSFLITGFMMLTMWLILRLKIISTWLFRFFILPLSNQDIKSAVISPTVASYYLSFYVILLFNINTILFHLSQSYHCLWLPFIRPVTIVTQTAMKLRFQSLTVSFMMLPPMLLLIAINVIARSRLFQHLLTSYHHDDKEFPTESVIDPATLLFTSTQCEHDE